METIKKAGASLINSPIGAVVGIIGGYWASKKFLHVENKWALAGLAIAGGLIGAAAEYKIKAAMVKPAQAAKK